MEIYKATQIIMKHKEWFHDQENLPKLDEDEVIEAYKLFDNLLNPVKNNVALDFVSGITHDTTKEIDDKVAIKKGCVNEQCYCNGSCNEVIGYRDKLPNEQ